MEIDSKVGDAARVVAQHLGAEAKRLGTGHDAYRDIQKTREWLYKFAQAKHFNEADLQSGASQIISYLEQYGDLADPQVMAFRDANEALLKELAGNEPGITPPKRKPSKASR
jgi:hypothetical protein